MPNNEINISEMIEKKRREAGLSGTALAMKAGIPEKTFRKLQDGTTADPRYKTLQAISKALGCTLSELIGETPTSEAIAEVQSRRFFLQWEKLTPENKDVVVDLIESLSDLEDRLKGKKEVYVERQVPLYSLSVSAGLGSVLDDSENVEYVNFPANEIPNSTVYAVRVSGDSMQPAYYQDDIVFVEPGKRAKNGDVVIALINGESYIKQFRDGNFISFNPAYAPIIPGEFDNVQISGIVRACHHA